VPLPAQTGQVTRLPPITSAPGWPAWDMTLAMTFGTGLVGARPLQGRLWQGHGRRRGIDGHRPGIMDYTHSTPFDWAGATRNHIGKNPLRLGHGRLSIAIDGRMAAWVSIGTLSLHVQYAPCERVSRKPRIPRGSLITVSSIVEPPHRLHSIGISRLRLSFSNPPTLDELSNISRTIFEVGEMMLINGPISSSTGICYVFVTATDRTCVQAQAIRQ
jgi:hypothetical protein